MNQRITQRGHFFGPKGKVFKHRMAGLLTNRLSSTDVFHSPLRHRQRNMDGWHLWDLTASSSITVCFNYSFWWRQFWNTVDEKHVHRLNMNWHEFILHYLWFGWSGHASSSILKCRWNIVSKYRTPMILLHCYRSRPSIIVDSSLLKMKVSSCSSLQQRTFSYFKHFFWLSL